jgi:hypothetical protein
MIFLNKKMRELMSRTNTTEKNSAETLLLSACRLFGLLLRRSAGFNSIWKESPRLLRTEKMLR